jgi:hypothetical protein
MADRYAVHGVSFAFLYTREAHPGENYPRHTSLEQKLATAQDMVKRFHIKRPVLVDDLDGPVHHAYGLLPNMTYIVSGGGTVMYRAAWTDERTIEIALQQFVFERGRRGRPLMPYYVEWAPSRVVDRSPFMEGLMSIPGPRAAREFVEAMAHAQGETVAAPLRQWLEKRSAAPNE